MVQGCKEGRYVTQTQTYLVSQYVSLWMWRTSDTLKSCKKYLQIILRKQGSTNVYHPMSGTKSDKYFMVVYRPTKVQVLHRPTKDQVVHRPTKDQVVHRLTKDQVVHRPTKDQVVHRPTKDQVVHRPTEMVCISH